MNEPDIEELAAVVHKAYCDQYEKRHGKPYWTGGDYRLLDNATQEYDRVTVRAVLRALGGRVVAVRVTR